MKKRPRQRERGEVEVEKYAVLNNEKVFKGKVNEFSNEKSRVPKDKGGCRPLGIRAICNIYDSSSEETPKINPIEKDKLFCLTQLAMWSYNFKEDTNFDIDNVKVIRGNRLLFQDIYYYITFKAFEEGVATIFQTKICYYFPKPCPKIEIIFVRIIPADADFDDFAHNSKNYRPHPKVTVYRNRLHQLIENDPQYKLPIYLSQFALINYNSVNLHVYAARHDIPSLKIVKPMEHVGKQTTYLLTFEASLCDDTYKVETFQTKICIPKLSSTTTIEFRDFVIKTNS